jgi:hypothetical protein
MGGTCVPPPAKTAASSWRFSFMAASILWDTGVIFFVPVCSRMGRGVVLGEIAPD